MSLLDNWKHMDNHMMDFNWAQEVWAFIIFAFIIFLTLIIILLYFLKKSTESMINEKKNYTEPIQKNSITKINLITHCPECGNKINDKTMQFCPYCGNKI